MNQLQLWNQFKEMDSMQSRMANFFTSAGARSPKEAESSSFYPALDISEDKEAFYIKTELPDVKKEDIKVECRDGVLTISGEKKFEKDTKNENKKYYRIERSYGSFMRSFTLPEGADATHVLAEFNNGILDVKIAKRALPQSSTKLIPVK